MGASHREERFRDLYDRCWRPVRAYVLRRSRDPAASEDVVAEVFLTAWRRLDDIPADRELPWLYGTARNVLSNSRRSHVRRLRLVKRLAAAATVDSQTSEEIADQRLDRLERALDDLGEADLEILRLANWERLSHAEIALVMDCTANAVAIRLHRARKRLAKLVGPATDTLRSRPAIGQPTSMLDPGGEV